MKSLVYLVRTGNAYQNGWIMAGVFKNAEEAKHMLTSGILPTHVIHLIPPYDPPLDELLYCHVPLAWPEYRRTILTLRDAFKARLIVRFFISARLQLTLTFRFQEIHLGKRKLSEVVDKIIQIIKIRKGIAPIKPRVVIVGPRGSGRSTQAELLQNHLGVVHGKI